MATNRKYAALPDLDSAPDIYETPSLTDDNSTAVDPTVRSQSPSSDYQDFDDADSGDGPTISHSRLHPDAARNIFEPSRVDARDVDFSDRINGKKRSYKSSSRRVKVLKDGTQELGDWSDEEEGESLERKMARLRREIEEVREEAESRRLAREREGGNIDDEGADKEIEDAAALSRLLDGISMSRKHTTLTPASRLAQSLSADLSPSTAQPTSTTPSAESTAQEATYTVTYAPNFPQSHSLVKASAIDARLTEIEKALGLPSTLSAPPTPLLPTLDSLTSQLHLLATTTPTSLESVSRRIRGLITETERLTAARKEAKAAISNDEDAGMVSPGIGDGENSIRDAAAREQASKITALYGTLATIESLAPALPGVLERLRSLRKVHAEAAGVAERWTEAIMRQEDMGAEIERWREGLEKVELAVKNGERVGGENAKVVEGWIRELEQRLKRLEG